LRPAPRIPVRRLAAPALVLALGAALAWAPAASAGILTPENRGGSPNAEKIHLLYSIVFYIGVVIFLLVESILIYSLVKFRFRRGMPAPAQVRGNTVLEVSWTIGAALILVVLATVTFLFLSGIKNPVASGPHGLAAEQQASSRTQLASINQPPPPGPPNSHLTVNVNGQQFVWRFDYPDAPSQTFNYYDMYVPTDTTVVLNITSSDVVHAWWIPSLGGQQDATPGYVNHSWFRISKPGVYEGTCAELCGKGHADMRARVIAVSPAAFRAWEARQAAALQQSQALLALSRKYRGQGP
jgi:cytochrome c oxidase subunit II